MLAFVMQQTTLLVLVPVAANTFQQHIMERFVRTWVLTSILQAMQWIILMARDGSSNIWYDLSKASARVFI